MPGGPPERGGVAVPYREPGLAAAGLSAAEVGGGAGTRGGSPARRHERGPRPAAPRPGARARSAALNAAVDVWAAAGGAIPRADLLDQAMNAVGAVVGNADRMEFGQK